MSKQIEVRDYYHVYVYFFSLNIANPTDYVRVITSVIPWSVTNFEVKWVKYLKFLVRLSPTVMDYVTLC